MGERLIQDIVTEMADDVRELLQFAYELIKTDQNREFIYELLNG